MNPWDLFLNLLGWILFWTLIVVATIFVVGLISFIVVEIRKALRRKPDPETGLPKYVMKNLVPGDFLEIAGINWRITEVALDQEIAGPTRARVIIEEAGFADAKR